MKFSTILTSAFFALFIFATTTTTANANYPTTETEIQLDKEETLNIINIVGRTAEITDTATNTARIPNYTIQVTVMKNMNVVAEATGNTNTLTMDLSDLDSGNYLFVIRTSSGVERKLVPIQ